MKQFKIRCSQIGKIMTQPKEKKNLISKTTQSYVEDWIKEQVYGRTKEFTSKYTEKGKDVEQDSIDFACKMLGLGMMFKNDKMFENDYLIGTPDIILKDEVIEMKNSWDCFTFPLLDLEIPNDLYYWQIQGYLALTGKAKARLIYTLMDTPDHLIKDEIRRYQWKLNMIDVPIEMEQEIYDRMTYAGIPDSQRFKCFEVFRDDLDIKMIYEQVEKCRQYINQIIIEK